MEPDANRGLHSGLHFLHSYGGNFYKKVDPPVMRHPQ